MARRYAGEATRSRPCAPCCAVWLLVGSWSARCRGPHGTRHARERGNAHRSVAAGSSWDQAIRNHSKEDRPRFRWRIRLPVAVAAKMLQFPRLSMLQKLSEAVFGAHYRSDRHRLWLARPDEENRPADAALALAHHARHHSRRLKPCEPLFGGPGVQTTIGVVDGNRGIHGFWGTRGVRGKAAGVGFTSVPALYPHRSHTNCASTVILSETES